MPRPRKATPSYLPHRGKARAVWTDDTGQHFRTLPGPYNSKESRAAFARLQLEMETEPAAPERPAGGLFVAELLVAYHAHAKRHYRDPDGRPTSELGEVSLVARGLNAHYGTTRAADFGPLALKALRQAWVSAKLSRSECNRRVRIVRRIFKWAAGEELIPFEVYHRLTAVTGLQKGRTAARETEPIGPVDDATVDATLPYLTRHVRGMIEFQRLTGCRPGEACRLRLADIDAAGPVWFFRPPHHKTAHRGKARTVAIGPKAQALIREFATDDPAAYVFSPARAVAEVRAARSATRTTPRYPSHEHRNKEKRAAHPKRRPSERYSSHAYVVAVSRACRRAGVDPWTPNQLRHSQLTHVRERYGLEAAQSVAGHERADVTQVYAERNLGLAAKVAAELG